MLTDAFDGAAADPLPLSGRNGGVSRHRCRSHPLTRIPPRTICFCDPGMTTFARGADPAGRIVRAHATIQAFPSIAVLIAEAPAKNWRR